MVACRCGLLFLLLSLAADAAQYPTVWPEGQPGEEALKIRKAVLDSLYALDMFVYKREYNGIGEALKGDFGVDRVIVDITAPLKDLDAAAAAYDKFLAAVSM